MTVKTLTYIEVVLSTLSAVIFAGKSCPKYQLQMLCFDDGGMSMVSEQMYAEHMGVHARQDPL